MVFIIIFVPINQKEALFVKTKDENEADDTYSLLILTGKVTAQEQLTAH